MPEIYKEKILKLLKHTDYKPLKLTHLAKELGVGAEDYPQFKLAFDLLQQAGHVVIGAGNLISLPSVSSRFIGKFRANPKGFGFVIPLELSAHGDLFIPPGQTADAMNGDTVVAKVVRKGLRAGQMRLSGKIVEILERAQNKFVGTLAKLPNGWIVQPDGTQFLEPISVDDVTAKNAREKDKVVVEIISYPSENHLARGVIIEVLGKAGRYDTEIKSVIRQYNIPEEFSEQCYEQARLAAEQFGSQRLDQREDITNKVTITIDPPDAKDFDDAISLERDSRGNWVLGVHIADVSFFIPADSPLDAEGKVRGNSAYLPGKTIPMLPEILSNGICSLQPDQKRFVKSAYLTYDRDGNIISRRFANSVMRSAQRLTYLQADGALRGHTKGIKPEVVELLKNAESLSRVIEERRKNNGALHLDLPEIEVIFDKSGRIVGAQPAEASYPHTMIEMFMVEANEAVASALDRANIPVMRRIHPEPDSLTLKELARLVRGLGYKLPRTPDRFALQNLLDAVKDTDSSIAINTVVLRSFEKARYSPLNVGHYALASTHYCHFTSPIRRYADLLVHRVLQLFLERRIDSAGANQILSKEELIEIGSHITFTEERAEDAEEELKSVLILQMLSDHIGDELDCVVTGLTNFGIFVQSKKYGIEGLIQMADLGPDEWKYNPKTCSVIGLGSGFTIFLGRPMKVQIISVNVSARKLSVAPVKPLVEPVRRLHGRVKQKKFEKRQNRRMGRHR
jgi:ribonuclease R